MVVYWVTPASYTGSSMNRAATSPHHVASRGKLMATLFTAQVCGSTGHSIGMAVGSIMAAGITGTNTWSGLPVAVGALGTALASWPLARLMDRSGRRPGLVLGYALSVGGAALGIVGMMTRSFPLLLVGMALFGIAQTSNLLARYAAADVSPGPQRGRAMGLIVWGSAVGSLVGPNLMEPAVRAGAHLDLSPAASAFLISLAGYGLAAILVEIFLRPDPLAIARRQENVGGRGPAERARSLGGILGDLRVQLALATLTISQFVMISTTSTSPVYLHDHGYSVGAIGIAVSLHLGGMYVTSPLSGWLSDRAGRLPTIGAGALVLIGAVTLAGFAPGTDRVLVIGALFLNGVGWNLAFVSGSALLTDALSPAERASTQGLADLFMGMMGAFGSAAGGMILGVWGFAILNTLGAALVLGPLALSLLRWPTITALSTGEG
ncbi:MAG: MFS transporter [Candidatus Rokuibacteriota bacterium]|nr:MAG: MFS transporter [Candidatus Rokubacteria bacterium]